jgi:Concanavalin A-like lectin/glucanases superfamily
VTFIRRTFFAVGSILITAAAAAFTNPGLEFNGTSDHIDLTTNPLIGVLNTYTIEAWEYPTTSTGAHRVVSTQQLAPSRGLGFGTRDLKWRHTTFGIKDYDTAVGSVTTGTWTHIAMTLDAANTATFYKNGVFLASVTHGVGALDSTGTMNIGRNPINTEYWQGRIDEVRIWNYVRSASEISTNYLKPLVGNESGLILYLPFSEGIGTAIDDLSPTNADGTLTGGTWIEGPPVSEGAEARDWSLYP